jgi:uncharacterized Ntn-hydrolase superfamily protein
VTFSLVACDPDAREWGVVVASKFLAVGAVVPWARAEVGAIATQAYANVAYGPDGLALLAAGHGAQEVVDRLTAPDREREQRQLGVVDAAGAAATFTGRGCLDWAGGRAGDGYAAPGNILTGPDVVEAMAAAFDAAGGTLAERLLIALAAGDAAGGDRRGRQSAAILVCRAGAGYGGATDVLCDLRIDDHADPVAELRRLHAVHVLLFGRTPPEHHVPLDPALQEELADRLERLGYSTEDGVEAALARWAGVENLEERLSPTGGTIDPVVLGVLRERAP